MELNLINPSYPSVYVPRVLKFGEGGESTFCPHSVFMCFVWISGQRKVISQYSINWLVFITETGSVYCAIRTGSLYTSRRFSLRRSKVCTS